MADLLIIDNVWNAGFQWTACMKMGPIWTGNNVGYIFLFNDTATLVYIKTTDGGLTWSSDVTIKSGNIPGFSIWPDWWTPGDGGTNIHIVYAVNDPDAVSYRRLDTADDSLSAEVNVTSPVITSSVTTWQAACVDIVKTRGGHLIMAFWADTVGARGTFRSTNGGASWSSRAQVADGDEVDRILLFPGNEVDPNDIWCIYWDVSAQELSLKVYDQSANTWSETSIATGHQAFFTISFMMAAMQRHSDNHVIVTALTNGGTNAADLKLYDIVGPGDTVTKSNVFTNEVNHTATTLTIDQQVDALYVGYTGDPSDTSPTAARVRYKKSTDGGTTWSAATIYDQSGENNWPEIFSGVSVDNRGGKWMMCFVFRSAGPNHALFTNVPNSVVLGQGRAFSSVVQQQRTLLL